MLARDLDAACAALERQELEVCGAASPLVYSQLLAIYLYQNDLCNAKFLWKRIPQSIVSSNPELPAIWLIGQKMWKKDLPGTYRAIASYNWTESLTDIIKVLEERVRERAFNLIGRSYSSISLDTVSSMTGLASDAVSRACLERQWVLTDNGTMVTPKPPIDSTPQQTSSEDQLAKLTEFVSFLEN